MSSLTARHGARIYRRVYGRIRVAAVIPAYNEERLVGRTVGTIPAFVDHVVLVDDASRDATSAEARRAGDSRLSVLRHPANRGVGAAIVTGYREALRLGADAAVVVAGDGQMDPTEMERLLEPLASGAADYVKGNRLDHPELRRRMPAVRRVGNRALTFLTRVAVGDTTLQDSQCGYTAISRRALEALPLERVWPRYGYPNDLIGQLQLAGLRVVDRPVTPIYGSERSGIRPVTFVPMLGFVLARSWVRRRLSR